MLRAIKQADLIRSVPILAAALERMLPFADLDRTDAASILFKRSLRPRRISTVDRAFRRPGFRGIP